MGQGPLFVSGQPDDATRVKALSKTVRGKHALRAVEHDVEMYIAYAIAQALTQTHAHAH